LPIALRKLEKYWTERVTERFTDFHDRIYALLSLDDFASANINPDPRKSNSELFLEVGAFFARSMSGARTSGDTELICMLWTFWRVDCQYTEGVRKLDEFLTSCQID
jgi:hypothetical protein